MIPDDNEQSALVPANYSQLPKEAKKANDSTFDRIYKFFHNHNTRIELTIKETAILERWEKSWLLLCRRRTKKQVVDIIVKLYNVERAIAFDDVNKSMQLSRDPRQDLKAAKREIAETNLLQGADKAWKEGDMEMHFKYMKEYSELNKLKDEELGGEMADLIKNWKPNQIMIVSTIEELQQDIKKLQDDLTEDTEFSIVDEN